MNRAKLDRQSAEMMSTSKPNQPTADGITRRQLTKEANIATAASVVAPLLLHAHIGAKSFDIVIKGGRGIDRETAFDAVRKVGIRDGKIAAITQKVITGKETIDATNHVVTPGFVDEHFALDSSNGLRARPA